MIPTNSNNLMVHVLYKLRKAIITFTNGKQLSYNNYFDIESAIDIVFQFE